MRLTTKMRYGTRAMVELAKGHAEGPISLATIARRQNLPEKYLEALMGLLRAAGLVRALRGAQGGYLLAAPPERISVRRIFDALEGPEAYAPCIQDPAMCQRSGGCATQEVWTRMYRASMEVLASTTLADLAARAGLAANDADMYHI